MDNIWIYIISPLITAFLSWFFTRKQYQQEIKKLQTENDDADFEYLKKVNNDLEERLDKLAKQSQELFNQVVSLTEENRKLRLEVEKLRNDLNMKTTDE